MAESKNKNWLLNQLRTWHTWLGVGAAIFILGICLSGIYLNHKDLFRFGAPGEDERKSARADGKGEKPEKSGAKYAAREKKPKSTLLNTATEVDKLPISLPRAMQIARAELGESPMDAIELKEERGKMVYKVKLGEDRELYVDAQTGATRLKEKDHKDESYREAYTADKPSKAGWGGYDWGKIIKDLHTGKIGGEVGKLFNDLVAIIVMLLTLSGLYLWAVVKLRKRKSAREAAARQAAIRAALAGAETPGDQSPAGALPQPA